MQSNYSKNSKKIRENGKQLPQQASENIKRIEIAITTNKITKEIQINK